MAQNPINTRLFYRYSLFAAMLLCSAAMVQGQAGAGIDSTGTGGRHIIQGRLIFPSGQRVDSRLKIKLEAPGQGDLTVLSDINGNFGFTGLRPGNYIIVIEGEYFETVREQVFIEPSVITTNRGPSSFPVTRPFNVQIYLRPKTEVAASNKPGVVNAALANVPKPAVALYERGLEFARAGETDKAIDQLKRAVELHPDFSLALNELGVQYMKKGDFDKAAEALARVVHLSPDAAEPILNYGIALFNQKKLPEAEVQLRAAVKKNDHSFAAHHYLGMTLIGRKSYADAEAELRRAIDLGGPRAGLAHYYLGGVYWQAGKLQQAADELETYLKLEPKAPQADKIRGTIKDLRSKQ